MNRKKDILLLKAVSLGLFTWFLVVIVSYLLLLKMQLTYGITNIFFIGIFIDREMLNCSSRRCSWANYTTLFDMLLLFVVGFLIRKYYYLPRIKKLK